MPISYADDFAYAEAKLSNSIVRVASRPFLVMRVGEGGNVLGRHLGYSGVKSVSLNELDLTPIPLGYWNSASGSASYLSRLPVRNWKQGLMANQIVMQTLNPIRGLNIDGEDFIKCLCNKYPSFAQTVEYLVCEPLKTLAFHKVFAMTQFSKKGNSTLLYKGEAVGNFSLDQRIPDLAPKYQFLQETLEEALNA